MQKLGEQADSLTMRILRAQAHLLDLQEALGGPAEAPDRNARPDAGPGSSGRAGDALGQLGAEVGVLEKLLDSGRGPAPASGSAILEEWSSTALLQDPGDRRPFRDQADHRAAMFRLADALRERSLWAGARAYYERLLKPPSPEAAAALIRAMECGTRLGDFPGVVESFVRARREWSAPGANRPALAIPPEAAYLAGAAAFRRTDLEPRARDQEALQILASVAPPLDVPAAYLRGALFVRSGDLDRATQEFETCDRLSAKAPRERAQQEMCWLALARIDGQRWPWDMDRYWYRQLPRRFPRFQEALHEQAYNLQWAGLDDRALSILESIVVEDPESRLARDVDSLRAQVLSHLGRHSESMEAYERIRRKASALRDPLDEFLRAERGPAAYLAWFTAGQEGGSLPPKEVGQAIRRARASAEVAHALDLWSVLETATQALARARASSDRLDTLVVREAGRPPPGTAGSGTSWADAVGPAARDLDARVAAVEAETLGNADSLDDLTGPRRDRVRAARALRLRLAQARARALRDDRMLVDLRASPGRTPPAEVAEAQGELVDAQRQLDRMSADAQEVLGLRVHRSLVEVRAQLDGTILEAERGEVEVALARTRDAERRVEALVFRRILETSLPVREERDAVLANLEDRSRQADAEGLRVREEAIAQLSEYVRRHPDDPVYTPRALSRLAELQVEGSRASETLAVPRPRPPGRSRAVDDGLGVSPGGCAIAVELHRRLLEGFPSYRQKDGVFFLAGYCLLEMGKIPEARQAYLDLVHRYPDSTHVAEAWVRIGDLDFEDGRPPALRRAAEAYAKAAARTDHALYEHATYMLGWTRYRLDDLPGGLETLRTLLEERYPPGREAKGEVPLAAITLLGAMLADPRWDGVAMAREIFANGPVRAYEGVVERRLADELFDQGRYLQSIEAYRFAISRAPFSADAPRMQERIVLAWSREGRPKEEALERERLVTTYDESGEWSKRNGGSGAAPEEVRELVLASKAHAAATLHAQARSLEQAGKSQAATAEYRRAAQAYARVLEGTPRPRGAEGLALARAECTLGAGERAAAARMFEEARDTSGDRKVQQEAAQGAVRAWEAEAARQQAAGLLEGGGSQLPGVLRSLVSSADVLVARFPGDPLAPAAAFRAAEIFYRHHDWAEARGRLEDVVARWPGTEEARSASRLVVEGHLASRDWAAGEAAASQFRRQASPADAAFAAELHELELTSRFQRSTDLLGQKKWSEAAAIFQAIADEAPRHRLADKALYNAAICQEGDRHLQAAFALFGRVGSEYPDSPLVPESLFRQAALAEATFDFARAAERYQVLIDRHPKAKQVRDALYDRALSLEILQRYEEAGLAFERHASLGPSAADAPATLLHAAELFGKGSAWPRAVRALEEFHRRYGKTGDPELVVVAHLRAGRAESALGHDEAARGAYARAVEEFTRRKLSPGASPAGAAAAAEARFRLAERDLQRLDRSVLPATSQAGKLEKALKAQLSDTDKLATQYEELKRYQSPEWTVAALYRQGYLAARFARALYEAPVPPELERAGKEQYLAAYRDQLAAFARPYDDQAVSVYARTTAMAQELRVESEWSRRAAAALVELRPAEFERLRRAKGRFLPADPPNPEEREREARRALSENETDVTAMVQLAITSLAGQRVELARAVLASAQKVAPDDATVWNGLGRVDLALGGRARAEARWKKAVELAPGHADALTNLGQLLVEAGDHPGAAVSLEQAVRSAPASAPSWLDLGNAYRGMGRLEDARRAYEKALALDAKLVDAQFNLGLLPPDAGKSPTSGGVR